MHGRIPAALLALAVLLALPAAALALPGDPPVAPVSPADGAAVDQSPTGIEVAFSCPAYRSDVYGDPANPTVDTRGPADYAVRFSLGAALDATGALATQTQSGSSPAPRGDGTCTSKLADFDGATPATLVGKRVFWQVSRTCLACTPQGERGPVRSFTITPARIAASLVLPSRLYAGYLGLFAVRSQATPADATVELQVRRGSRWSTFARHAYVRERTQLTGKLPAGRRTIRAVVAGQTVATKAVTVRRPGARRTSARDDGAYAARDAGERRTARLAFRVAGGGRVLRGFSASVTTFCVGPTAADNRLFVASAVLRSAQIAPDGSVVGVLRTSGGSELLLSGRLRGARFRGEVSTSFSTCSGTRKLDAVRR
jgi:hypothetical protein